MFYFSGELLEEVEKYTVEGDVVKTESVSRAAESFYNTQYDREIGTLSRMSADEIHSLRTAVEQQLSSWHEVSGAYFMNRFICR